MGKALGFVAEIPPRTPRTWKAPGWVKRLRRDKWMEIPIGLRSEANTLRAQLKRAGFLAQTRSVNGVVVVYARRAP